MLNICLIFHQKNRLDMLINVILIKTCIYRKLKNTGRGRGNGGGGHEKEIQNL